MSIYPNLGGEKNNWFLPAAIRSLSAVLVILSMMMFAVPPGFAQGNTKPADAKNKQPSIKNEVIDYFYFDELLPREQQTAIDLKKFLNSKGLSEVALLFSPVAALNTRYLKAVSKYTICIGKESQNNVNDYVLFIFANGVSNGSRDDGALNNFKALTDRAKECTLIRYSDFTQGKRRGQKAIYTTIAGDQIAGYSRYITNFESYLKSHALQIRYPYTVLLTPKTANLGKVLHLQASLYYDPHTSNKADGAEYRYPAAKRPLALFASWLNEDNYIVINSIDKECCCQVPPL